MRRDIQLLRGIAVLAVVLYHANLVPLKHGYLGVDIFFVISGFLITSIVLRGLATNSFSFTGFYLRRARRLLPALYSTLAITTLLGLWFLTDHQWVDYRNQLLGALTFTANLMLPFQVGYFDDAAASKPLLHIWSLSLEEQYYFVLPVLLFLVARRFRGLALAAAFALSFAFCQFLLARHTALPFVPGIAASDWAFYLLPSRAWELLAGSLVAWGMLRHPAFQLPALVKRVALLLLLVVLCVSLDERLLGMNAWLAVLLTSVLVAGHDNWLPDIAPARALEKLGDWSYSLYLVHWPLLAFAHSAYLGVVPRWVTLALLALALLLSRWQYRYVEERFRHGGDSADTRGLWPIAALTLGMLALPLLQPFAAAVTGAAQARDFIELRRINAGFGMQCTDGAVFEQGQLCANQAQPRVAVWGDSLAMHLVPGLLANPATADSLIQITRSACNPMDDLTPVHSGAAAAQACAEFNTRAMRYLRESRSIQTVVIGSTYSYFYGGYDYYLAAGEQIPRDNAVARQRLMQTVRALQDAGKEVWLVTPPPSTDFEVGDCLERAFNGAVLLGRRHCDIDAVLSRERLQPVMDSLEAVQAATGASLISLPALLCGDTRCATTRNGIPLYRDRLHLSVDGSVELLQSLPLPPVPAQEAASSGPMGQSAASTT
ncbi:MAG: acyltransferase family protein [Halioglobus sp.]